MSLIEFFLLCVVGVPGSSAHASDLVLPWVFTDHMVLQRDQPIAVWGQAERGAVVTVSLGDEHVEVTADDRGGWRAELAARRATAQGMRLAIGTGLQERVFEDVVVGEVWLCAGQSNMDFPLSRSVGGAEAVASISRMAGVRLCNRTGSPGGGARRLTPDELLRCDPTRFYDGSWSVANATSAPAFSAVAFYFGRMLCEHMDAPIGLIDVSVGGSTTEGWMPLKALRDDPAWAPLATDFLSTSLSHPFIRERTTQHLGAWFEAGKAAARPRHFFEPGFLFESAIEPLAPYGIRGVLWYQGESNAHLPRVADRLFRTMVDTWREAWRRPALPFHVVQLPSMNRASWPEFREVQAGWADDSAIGMAVTLDVGHVTNVHPTNKRPVGERLARVALAETYGRDVEAWGPTFAELHRHPTELSLRFDHAEGLCWAEGCGPTGFEVAGDDRRFHPARAEIRGDRVWLSSPRVKSPKDARYAWAPVPKWSLTNAHGLPAAPFRTHAWRPVRIACVGDSITSGHGLESPEQTSYPARLQQALGDGFDVRNFGRPGAGVVLSSRRGNAPRAFRKNEEHEAACLFLPHVVISNLGINDLMDWRTSGDAFVADYGTLLDDYHKLSTQPSLVLWSPLAPLFPTHGWFGAPEVDEIHAAIAEVIEESGAAAIDLNAPLQRHGDEFPDGIHPNARAANHIAEVVLDGLRLQGLVPTPRR